MTNSYFWYMTYSHSQLIPIVYIYTYICIYIYYQSIYLYYAYFFCNAFGATARISWLCRIFQPASGWKSSCKRRYQNVSLHINQKEIPRKLGAWTSQHTFDIFWFCLFLLGFSKIELQGIGISVLRRWDPTPRRLFQSLERKAIGKPAMDAGKPKGDIKTSE